MTDDRTLTSPTVADLAAQRHRLHGARPTGTGTWLARRAMLALAGRAGGAVAIRDATGTTSDATDAAGTSFAGGIPTVRTSTGGGPGTPTIVVRDARAYAAVLRRGSVGLGEAYVAGWWDSDDLTGTVRGLFRATEPLRRRLDAAGAALAPVLDALRRPGAPTRARDRDNVRSHYDLSDELFSRFLDETMAYSCAVFTDATTSLADAQRAKFDRICRKLALGSDDHVVEIGTGWGGFALHAATAYGCRVTTTTLSEHQLAEATERVGRAGLARRVTVLGEDYRDLRGRFDALVSIEMVEAVDWRHHRTFMRACRRLVRDDGRIGLQAIVMDEASEPRARHHADFIRAMVFPGGCIPSVRRLVSEAAAAGLRTVDLEDIGAHYAETLRRWRANLHAASGEMERLGFGAALRRLWDLYLAYCEAAFLERHISDVQLVLAPPGWRGGLGTRPA